MPRPGPRVALLSPGAKVGLTGAFAAATRVRGGRLLAWESDPWSPAARLCQARGPGGPVEDDRAVEALLAWCAREGIGLAVPTRHDDLPALAAARDRFAAAGVGLAVAGPACVRLCLDKAALHAWLVDRNHPVPVQSTVAALAASPLRGRLPLIAKSPRGSGSRQLRRVEREADLAGLPGEWLAQAVAPGVELTVNAYVDRRGRSVCEIPHQRLMVSEGEVVRGRTVRVPVVMELARRIAEELPGAAGPMNIQCFWDAGAARATVIEVNPRFGGGYPLAHRAGGRFADWLLAEHLDGWEPPRLDGWQENLLMVRYRSAAFFPEA